MYNYCIATLIVFKNCRLFMDEINLVILQHFLGRLASLATCTRGVLLL
jgi:hypothetical protein